MPLAVRPPRRYLGITHRVNWSSTKTHALSHLQLGGSLGQLSAGLAGVILASSGGCALWVGIWLDTEVVAELEGLRDVSLAVSESSVGLTVRAG